MEEFILTPTWDILAYLEEGVLLVEQDGTLRHANPAAQELLDFPSHFTSLDDITHDFVTPELWESLLHNAPCEIQFPSPNGWMTLRSRPGSQPTSPIHIIINCKQESLANTDPTVAQEQIQALARVSHELNATLLLDDVLETVLNEATLITGATGGQISLYDRSTSTYTPHIKRGQAITTPDHDQQVILSQKSLVISDFYDPDSAQIQSILITPIIYQGDTAGIIRLFADERQLFNQETSLFITAIANHAAIAIGNANRFTELNQRNTQLRRRSQQIEHFVESSRVFHSDRPLSEVYEDLVYAIQEGVGFDVVLLSLAEEHNGQWYLRRVTAAGLPLDRLREMQRSLQPWSAIEALLIPENTLGSTYFIPSIDVEAQDQLVSHSVIEVYQNDIIGGTRGVEPQQQWQEDDVFFIPMRNAKGDLLGLISLDAPLNGQRPNTSTAGVLEIFANQAATAIENFQLFHDTRSYASQLQQLYDVSQTALRESNFDTQIGIILNGLQGAGWERVTLTLRDKDFNATRLLSRGLSREEHKYLENNMLPAEVWRKRLIDPAVQKFRHGSCYFIPHDDDWAKDNLGIVLPDHTVVSAKPNAWHPHDILFLPLYDQQGTSIGLIGLDQPDDGQRPTKRNFQIIELYAQFATAIIENYQLFTQILSRSEELQTLVDASQAISGTLEQSTILTAIGEHMLRAIVADAYTVYEWRPEKNQVVVTSSHSLLPHMFAPPRPGSAHTLNQTSLLSQVIVTSEAHSDIVSPDNTTLLPSSTAPDTDSCMVATLPLTLRGELFGAIEIRSFTHPVKLKESQLQLMGAIINQGTTALEMAHLFEETYQRERFYAALGRVSLAINATLDLANVLDLICKESLSIFKVESVYIWHIEGQQLVGTAARGRGSRKFIGTTLSLSEEGAFSVGIAEHGYPIYINDVQNSERLKLNLPQHNTIQAVMGIPLKNENEVVGVLLFADRKDPQRFDLSQVERANIFGVQTSIAIQNAQLVTELRQLNEELDDRVATRTQALAEESERVKILLRISSELTASLDKDRVLKLGLHLVNEVVNAKQGVILLLDHETQEFVFQAAFGMPTELPETGRPSGLQRSEGLAGWIVDNRQALVIDDTHDDERWVERPQSREHRSVLGVPLISGGDVIGVMMLFHTQVNVFTHEQLDLVEAAAIQIASAIYNASLYDLIRHQAERLGTMMREAQIDLAKTQSILESIADGVLVADAEGRIILVNDPICSLLDMVKQDLIEKPVFELIGLYGTAGDSWVNTIKDWADHRSSWQERVAHVNTLIIDELVINVTLSPVYAGSQYFGTVSIFRDVTKEAEVDRMKSEFVSTVSHELRTPMTSIKGYADLMLMGAAGSMSDSQERYLQVIKRNADRLKLLVDDLLDISRIETGKTELNLQPLDVSQVVMSVATEHARGRLQSEDKDIAIETNIESSLPLAFGDPEKVTRILTNLVDNAINYTPAGGSVTIKAQANGEYILVDVKDTGIGISEENKKKIFDRFFRADDSAVQKVSGTGLGLAIVQSLVDMHGGELIVNSKLGEGSTFSFSLPMVKSDMSLA